MPLIHRLILPLSLPGIIIGLGLYSLSLTPSMVPRDYLVQGALAGIVFTIGYASGVAAQWLWDFLELAAPGRRARHVAWGLIALMLVTAAITLGHVTGWQNALRARVAMAPVESTYPLHSVAVSLATAAAVIIATRLLAHGGALAVRAVDGFLPRRASILLGGALFTLLLVTLVNGVVLKATIAALDESFALANQLLDDYPPPAGDRSSGGPGSLVDWDDIGRNGKLFIADGPSRKDIAAFLGRDAKEPIRVYAGFDTGDSLEQRAQIALDELIRVGGFERSVLIIATPTGTGWLDPSGTDTVEYLHGGDIATVSMQYSYLPSWLTLFVAPEVARESATALFGKIWGHWTTLPEAERPKLFLYGLSLGSLGSGASFDYASIVSDPFDGALWSGPPFLSRRWETTTRNRNPGSPEWRPVFRDSKAIRFMNQDGFPDLDGAPWGPFRIVFLQYGSDPMTFFSVDMAYEQPDWLGPDRAPDVSPDLTWVPLVTFFQVGFDVLLAIVPPIGYGHSFAPTHYIDAWLPVTRPKDWRPEDTERLKALFADFDPSPL